MTDFDCIIIGAGFAGLRTLIETRQRGLSARLIEAGSDVGGTWYWNRYPGARTDSASWTYCLSFDDEILQEWDWSERFPTQPEVQRYLAHVAERHDLNSDIEFGTRVERAGRNDADNSWIVETDTGRTLTSTFLVMAVGPLSQAYEPPFPGLGSFRGERYLTARWPKEKVDFAGKRVGIIGTGATAVQLIPLAARTAEHLTVFQRTPNYVLPARNATLEDLERDEIKADYSAVWNQVHAQPFGMPVKPAGRVLADVDDEEERHKILDRGWEDGGWHFLFETFDDLLVNQAANDVAAEFIRNKIRTIVEDPATAELLCPKTYPYGAKRPPLGHYYYETFNRDDVTLVDVSDNPIESVTEAGPRLADGAEYDVDVLIFATGFDAASGAISAIDVRGTEGFPLNEAWKDGAQTHLGLGVTGFPNMFILGGPGLPFANFPPVLEFMVKWIGTAIAHLRDNGIERIEADRAAMDAWGQKLQAILDATILGQGEAARTWFLGANIPGKPHTPLFYLGGVPSFFKDLNDDADNGYAGFSLSGSASPEPART